MLVRVTATDVHDAGARQILGEDREKIRTHRIVQRVERLIDDGPGGRTQHEPGECHALLFILGQFPIPTHRLIQQCNQAIELEPSAANPTVPAG